MFDVQIEWLEISRMLKKNLVIKDCIYFVTIKWCDERELWPCNAVYFGPLGV